MFPGYNCLTWLVLILPAWSQHDQSWLGQHKCWWFLLGFLLRHISSPSQQRWRCSCNVTFASSLWHIPMQTSQMLLITNFTYPSVTTSSGTMVCSNWHIALITQLLFCQCPTSLFNSLFVKNSAIVHVMLSTTNVRRKRRRNIFLKTITVLQLLVF